jgi:hypothetical protein
LFRRRCHIVFAFKLHVDDAARLSTVLYSPAKDAVTFQHGHGNVFRHGGFSSFGFAYQQGRTPAKKQTIQEPLILSAFQHKPIHLLKQILTAAHRWFFGGLVLIRFHTSYCLPLDGSDFLRIFALLLHSVPFRSHLPLPEISGTETESLKQT